MTNNINEEFKKINLNPGEKIEPGIENNKNEQRKKTKLKKNFFWLKWVGIGFLGLLIVLIIIAIPIVVISGPFLVAAKGALGTGQEALEAVKSQNLIVAEEKLGATHEKLLSAKKEYNKLTWTKFVPGLHLYYNDGREALSTATYSLEAAQILLASITPYADVLGFEGQGSFMGGTAEDRIVKMVQTLDKITPEVDKVSEKLKLAQESLDKINPNHYPQSFQGKEIRGKLLSVRETLNQVNLAFSDARPVLEVLPKALGYPVGKKYLVIFQNDGELRPTGGFMTAFAVLHLDVGRVNAVKSDDIYGLDRKFGRGLPAPEPIKKYLPLVNSWHLRDMNLSPDFKVSMETFKENYDKLPGEYDVDGIITVDTEVLKRMVEVLGGIDVPGYGKFTVDNDSRCNIPQIICELEFIVDQPLATHVTARKNSILGPMMKEILSKSMSSGKNQWSQLFTTGIDLIQEKHILFYFVNPDLQSVVENFGAAGLINQYDGDYLAVVDANFGGAKSNLYVTQEVEQEINKDENGQLSKKVTIVYTHPEPADNCNLESGGLCLSGILRNWFRVYVPKGSKLVEARGSEVEVETSQDLGKTYFEGFFTLRPESRVKLIIEYTLPSDLNFDRGYRQLIQKQAGTKAWHYLVKFNGQQQEFDLAKDKEISFPD